MRNLIVCISVVCSFLLFVPMDSIGASTSTQITCNGTAKVIYAGSYGTRPVRSVLIQNQTPAVPVYIAPISNVTTSTGGILLLSSTGIGVVLDNGSEPWFCVTAGPSATIGVVVRN
jgi:hypothetical protein